MPQEGTTGHKTKIRFSCLLAFFVAMNLVLRTSHDVTHLAALGPPDDGSPRQPQAFRPAGSQLPTGEIDQAGWSPAGEARPRRAIFESLGIALRGILVLYSSFMDGGHSTNPHIIGLTGSFGSGCTYVADNILVRGKQYRKISLSDIVRDEYRAARRQNGASCQRRELQEFGDLKRKECGEDYFARKAIEKMAAEREATTKWVVDSIRNPGEIRALRNCSRQFFLFAICADRDKRWNRVREKYADDRREFDEDDSNDTGDESPAHGQRVADCVSEADIVITNNEHILAPGNDVFQSLSGRVSEYVDLAFSPLRRQQPLREEESLMAMAYAASQRSSCLKRKVGAVIVDDSGGVISSGFNEVPKFEKPCEKQYVGCFRDRSRSELIAKIQSILPPSSLQPEQLAGAIRTHSKLLDQCRALHAEENAIINLARNGRSVPLDTCTLYTTTYPCRLCANKIVNVGIKRVVYLEPYPDPEAKVILKEGDVRDEFFQGVTFKAYFRIYGEEK